MSSAWNLGQQQHQNPLWISLLIAEDILQQIGTQESLKDLSITPC